MNERPTPETDALREAIDNGAAVEAEMTSFAMKLERERDEAREERDIARLEFEEISNERYEEIQKVLKERDEARNKMADALQEVDLRTLDFERMKEERDDALSQIYQAECRAERFCQERDEAREAVAKWESSFDAMERAGAEQARRADENREWALRAERERDEARREVDRYREEKDLSPMSWDT